MEPPICPLCKVRERDHDTEPGRDWTYYESECSYSTYCTVCAMLSGTREHTHQHYPSPAQVAAGSYKADATWRTTEVVRPIWRADGKHVGYRCDDFARCGWEHYFTAEELEPCATHQGRPFGLCRNFREHRVERGELDPAPYAYITEYGREEERRRSDATVWDPGGYIAR